MGYPERIVPDETSPGILALHLARYVFAERWCRDRDVLDLGCGSGYGSAQLARTARRVVGGDISEAAIAYAQANYGAPDVEFVVLDAISLPFANESFDVVCSFETIEHLPDRDAYLAGVARVLRDGGTFIVSTPRVERTVEDPANPFHHVEYARPDFESLLARFFGHIEMYGQRRVQTARYRALRRLDVLGLRRRLQFLRHAAPLVGTRATVDVRLEDVAIDGERVDEAWVLVAVCGGPRK
ncbi:MAG TPA: class I SAM-dependent methyltransferase [Gaiellaceae bacterium]|jgi:SAM-dependent methyltransferase